MTNADDHGPRELRDSCDVPACVLRRESIEITRSGTPTTRIAPIGQEAASIISPCRTTKRRVRLATRPGYRPAMHPGDGTNLLTDSLSAMRDEERW